MLRISRIKKSFDGAEILRDASFDAHSGRLTILEGQNGAGKSTLFNILLGTLAPDHGHIILGDQDISHQTASERSHQIAILKQDPKASSSPSLSVWENCALALLKNRSARLHAALSPAVKDLILSHLRHLELDYQGHLDKAMGTLSGGQRQILAFAMATMFKPQLLLLDEPTAALDEKSSHLLMKLIKKLTAAWNIPAVMISHDHALNQVYGDVIVVLKDGVCVESTEP